jgi:hypothetical protein
LRRQRLHKPPFHRGRARWQAQTRPALARARDLFPSGRPRPSRGQLLLTGVEKIYALVGGFHLAQAPEDYLRQVMAELKKFDLEHVLPMHCSGQNFIDLAKQEMPEKLVLCTTGSRFTFTA